MIYQKSLIFLTQKINFTFFFLVFKKLNKKLKVRRILEINFSIFTLNKPAKKKKKNKQKNEKTKQEITIKKKKNPL